MGCRNDFIPWTDFEDERLQALRNSGYTVDEISASLRRRTPSACQQRISTLRARDQKIERRRASNARVHEKDPLPCDSMDAIDVAEACSGHLDDLKAEGGGWETHKIKQGIPISIHPGGFEQRGSVAALCAEASGAMI